MSSEINLLRGRIAVAKQTRSPLRLEAKGLISSIRDKLNPFEPNPAALQVDVAAASMKRLTELWEQMRELDEQIDEMEDALG